MTADTDFFQLNNDIAMPRLGLGTYRLADGDAVRQAIAHALAAGYRAIDTAAFYGNERGVGEAVRSAHLDRNEIFVTTKLWSDDQGYDAARRAFDRSMDLLGLETVDLYLIHWPSPVPKIRETWRALERIYREGRARAIGVSNHTIPHLRRLLDHADIVPAVNQCEAHPFLRPDELLEFCAQTDIRFQAWAPLARGRVFEEPVIQLIAQTHHRLPAQVTLRWALQKGMAVIPKSGNPERICANAKIFDFELSEKEMAQIDAIEHQERIGPDPKSY